MADPTTTSTVLAHATDRDDNAWKMRIAGHSLEAIANALGYPGGAREVSQVIRRRIQQGQKSIADQVDQAQALEYERLEAQRRAVWPRVMEWEKTNPRTGAPEVDAKGNPVHYPFDMKAHMLSLQLHDRVVKLFGLDKTKIEISGPGGGPIPLGDAGPPDLSRLTPAEMALLEHLHAKARGLDPANADTAALTDGADVVDVEPVES